MNRTLAVLAVAFLFAACIDTASLKHDAAVDAGAADSSELPADSAMTQDLIADVDLASSNDLAVPVMDLSSPPTVDLSSPPTADLSSPPTADLSSPPIADLSSPPADLATNPFVNVGFSCTLTCGGGTYVFMGVRPPATTGSDVINWTPIGMNQLPAGDQLWTYDPAHRVLVNQINQLALKVVANDFLSVGSSATDGTLLTPVSQGGGNYTLQLDGGKVVGLQQDNCPGGFYQAVAPGTAGYRTVFGLH